MSFIQIALEELFFGAGAWLGILLLLSIILALSLRMKEIGVVTLPVTVFLGIDYINNDLFWHATIMFVTTAFLILNLFRGRD